MEKEEKLLTQKELKRRENIASLLAFSFVALFMLNQVATIKFLWIITGIMFGLIIIVAAWFAGKMAIKSLFKVGAGLSLLIFLAQSYCDTPNHTLAGIRATQDLLAFGFLYLATEFIRTLRKEFIKFRLKLGGNQKNFNMGDNFFIFIFACFLGILIWEIYQVVSPIVYNLCVTK